MIAKWVFEKGEADNVISKEVRVLFGDRLREVQRIKSEGDFAAVEALVEGYGVKVDQELHAEILERNTQFTSAPYSGFVNPVLVPEMNDDGEITVECNMDDGAISVALDLGDPT